MTPSTAPQPSARPLHPFDVPHAQDLRARGSLKWTATDGEIAAWVAEADFGTAPAVTDALHAAVDRPLLGYLPPAVRSGLADACARWHRERYGWELDPGAVRPVGDVLAALRITVELYSRPGSPVILPTPAYMPFLTAPATWGREVIQVPMRTHEGRAALDLDGLERAFAAGGHLLVLVNPHNPTGRVMTRVELEALSEVVERNGGRVFSDEIHAPLTLPGARHVPYASVSAATARHTVTATAASKAWNVAGLKCAQVLLTDPDDVRTWEPHDHLLVAGASTLGAVASTAAYEAGGPWLDEVLDHLDGNRTALQEALHGSVVGHRPPEGTYLAWLDLRDVGGHGGGLARRLREATGVVTVDGAACGDAGRGFVRLNLAMPRPLVVEAGRRIAAWAGRA